jgi:N-formylglutamate amidohydrolase
MFGDSLPDFVNVRSARVAAGLGTVARCAGEGMDIYCQKLSFDTIMSRITDYYFQYHHALDRLIQQTRARFSASLLLDCHSMPSQQRPRSPNGAARLKGEPTRRTVQRRTTTTLADIVLGDNHSRSCAPWVTQVASDYFEQCGYHVARNQPYAGGYITVHRGKPDNGVHALQIEVNRALYMDEVSLQPNTALESLTSDMTGLVRTLIDAASFQLITPQAAE